MSIQRYAIDKEWGVLPDSTGEMVTYSDHIKAVNEAYKDKTCDDHNDSIGIGCVHYWTGRDDERARIREALKQLSCPECGVDAVLAVIDGSW